MSFLKNIFINNKNKINLTEEEIIDAGACPNCWGKQEYEGEYRVYNEDSTKSNINHDKRHQKAFVSQFVETYVSGIKLKKDGQQLICPTCYYSR